MPADKTRDHRWRVILFPSVQLWPGTRFVKGLYIFGAKFFNNLTASFHRNCANCCTFLLELEFVVCTQLWPVLVCRGCWVSRNTDSTSFYNSKKEEKDISDITHNPILIYFFWQDNVHNVGLISGFDGSSHDLNLKNKTVTTIKCWCFFALNNMTSNKLYIWHPFRAHSLYKCHWRP